MTMKKIEITINTGNLQDDEDLLSMFVNMVSHMHDGITFKILKFGHEK